MQRADIALYEAKKMERIKYVCIEKKNVIFRNKLLRFLLFDNRIGENF